VSDESPKPPEPGGTKIRLQSGLAAFAVVLPIFLWGNPWGVGAIALIAACWAMHEYVSMALPGERGRLLPLAAVLGLPLFALSALSTGFLYEFVPPVLRSAAAVTAWWIVVLLTSASWFLFTAESVERLADRWARFVLGLLYVPVTIGIFPALAAAPDGRGWLWAPLFAAWCGDIGGYFAGRAFGGAKMMPLISPKKTWSGFWGGVALACVGLGVQKLVFFSELTWIDCVVIGVIGDVAGVVGDLVESMLKRTFGVKDSGRFLPGHGGMLDRIDSVMFSLPVVWIWVVVARPVVVG
jgi:phosphatidate cytidylyltransferase